MLIPCKDSDGRPVLFDDQSGCGVVANDGEWVRVICNGLNLLLYVVRGAWIEADCQHNDVSVYETDTQCELCYERFPNDQINELIYRLCEAGGLVDDDGSEKKRYAPEALGLQKDPGVCNEETGELDDFKPIATFFVAWNGKGAQTFWDTYSSLEQAEGMIWTDTSYRNPWIRNPRVTEWKVGLSKVGNPIIFTPSAPPYYNPSAKPVANVPFRNSEFCNDNTCIPTGMPIILNGMDEDETFTRPSWNRARKALLEYYAKYSGI